MNKILITAIVLAGGACECGRDRDGSSRDPLEFATDRGFARSLLGHAGWTIGPSRSLALEASVRAHGSVAKIEYSQAFGQHGRAIAGITWIRGAETDFIGQYHRNSYGSLAIRYSF